MKSKSNDPKSKAAKSAESASDEAQTITRDDIASKLTELKETMPYLGDESSTVSETNLKVLAAGVGLAAAYFYGRRKGRRNNKTVIEVRRV